jgi:hypothetical protein
MRGDRRDTTIGAAIPQVERSDVDTGYSIW